MLANMQVNLLGDFFAKFVQSLHFGHHAFWRVLFSCLTEKAQELTSSGSFILEKGLRLAFFSEQQTLETRVMAAVFIKI